MIRLLVYGSKAIADMIYYDSLTSDVYQVVALVVDRSHLSNKKRPILETAREDCKINYNTSEHKMIVVDPAHKDGCSPMVTKAIQLGYEVCSYFSSRAIISPDAIIGQNTIILENAYIGPNVTIGENTIIRQNTYIGHDVRIGNDCFIASGTNVGGYTEISDSVWIGLGSVIKDKIKISKGALIGAGTVVIRDVPESTKVVGNPARVINNE